jgi:hypothetical protein
MPPGGDVNTTLPLVLSIICLACCCIPGGIFALINAMNANNAKKMGDLATAQSKARTSLIVSLVSMVLVAVFGTIYGVFMIMSENGSFK